MTVLGLDACRGGWVAIAIDSQGFIDAFTSPSVADAARIGLERWDAKVLVADTPVGLPDAGPRQADIQARKFIGPRRNSVFPTPVRAAVEADSYLDASAASFEACGKRISKQAWAITPHILDVDGYVRSNDGTVTVLEGHPEVSFCAMAGTHLLDYKKSFAGAVHRRELLKVEGIDLPDGLERQLKAAGIDDIHDAAAMAWTALRVSHGEAQSLPATPEVFSDGIPSAIWY